MKNVMLLLMIAAVAVAYDDMDDNYYNTLMNDVDALRDVLTCMMDKGPCNEFGLHAKKHISEALRDGCKECDAAQKHFTHLLIATTKAKLPEVYKQFEDKFDLKRKLLDALDDKIKQY